ncbi:hypothetical protein MHYP_G00309790 [Metynnis hypsauchen]
MSADLDEEADNNQPLEKTDQTMSTKAEVIEELMEALLQDVIAHSAALGCEVMSMADTEAEASTDRIQTQVDENDTSTDQRLAGDEMPESPDTEALWTTTGVRDLKQLSEKCKRHENSRSHLDSAMKPGLLGKLGISS